MPTGWRGLSKAQGHSSATAEPALPGRWWRPLEGLRPAAPNLPAQVWTAPKGHCLWQWQRAWQALRGWAFTSVHHQAAVDVDRLAGHVVGGGGGEVQRQAGD